MPSALQVEWVKLLERCGFDCFFTISPDQKIRGWRSADEAIWRTKIFLVRYFSGRRENVKAFIVAEPYRLGFWHSHGLLDSHGDYLLRRHLWAACKGRIGRNRFEPFKSADAVAVYVMKYCVKDSSVWDLIGIGKVGDVGGPAL